MGNSEYTSDMPTIREVARRWKGEFNDNSEAWAFFESFPELNHNAVIGYEFPISK